ncbi:MAG TPA: hypothetical protein VFQ37_13820 [Mycobacterium sp.]|nr:hypothetical protein [Mycobacterium sp.]
MDASDHDPVDLDQFIEGSPPGVDSAPAAGGPAHSVRPFTRSSRIAAAAGIVAALAAIGLGTAALLRAPQPGPSAVRTLQPITVASPPAAVLPVSGPDIFALLDRSPDFGPLGDPQRRASCLAGLGYPASTRVLGARPIDVHGRSGLLLVLPGEQAGTVVALAVAPNCSSADTGLFADTVVRRP